MVVRVGERTVGPSESCFVIAEAGVNHNGEVEIAKRLVDAAADAGADAVKFQTFDPQALVSPSSAKAEYQRDEASPGETQREMLEALRLNEAAHRELEQYSRQRGILFLSTPFDRGSANLLVRLGVPALKIGSGEVTNLPFLKYIAGLGKPIILSTGMANLGEVDAAVRTLEQAGAKSLVLLHCVTNYPAMPEDVNLRAMRTLRDAFGLPVGYSDHTMGLEVSLAAVAMGACVIEKHFTLDRELPGPDHRASLEPQGLTQLVKGIRTIEEALGTGRKEPAASEAPLAAVARRSLAAASDLPAGKKILLEDIAIIRPGTGLPPSFLKQTIGRVLRQDVAKGELLDWGMLE